MHQCTLNDQDVTVSYLLISSWIDAKQYSALMNTPTTAATPPLPLKLHNKSSNILYVFKSE